MMPGSSRGSSFSVAMKAAGLVFTVASLVFAAVLVVRHGGDFANQWADLRAAGWRPRAGWLFAAFAVATSNLFLLGGAWIRLLREFGGAIGYAEGMRVWTWTNLGRYLPGRVWQLSALTLYLREKRRIGGIGLGSNLTLQVLLLATGAAVAFAVLGVRLAEGRAALVGVAVGITAIALFVALRPSMVARLSGWMGRLMGESDVTVHPRRAALWEAAGLVVVSWFVNGLSLWLLWTGVGASAGPDPWLWTGSFAAAYLTGYVALFAPAGLVVREGALALVLVSFGGVGVAAAAGIAILARLLGIGSELAAAGLARLLPVGPMEDGIGPADAAIPSPRDVENERKTSS
ncbi:MAG: hypothetical protein ACODAB_05790 [Gemmatimonadota bacterium]